MSNAILCGATAASLASFIIAASCFDALAATPSVDAAEHMTDDVLEEIIVTATRRALPLQEAPVSMSALSQTTLHAIGARDIPDYYVHVPGINYTDDSWSHRVAIRGISTGSLEPRPLSALYLDDTPMMTVTGPPALGQLGGPHPEVFDLNRIEVLRGPQGTLFGTSAMGGAIRMVTNSPDPRAWYANAETAISSTLHGGDDYQISGVLNAPLSQGAAVRLVGFYRDDSGFIDDPQRSLANVNSNRTSGGRAVALWQATENLSFTLGAHHQQRRTGGLNVADNAVGSYAQARYR
jgi:iron complex outermembrane receptor protein